MGPTNVNRSPEEGSREFRTTHWTVVLAAAHKNDPDSAAALEQLCRAYWPPIYAYIRRRGYAISDAEDLTQKFFCQLLQKDLLAGVTREGGRFRCFLLTVLTRFLINEYHSGLAQKRGGGQHLLNIDDSAEMRYQRALSDQLTPELIFDRHWALTLLDRVFNQLHEEYIAAGKKNLFDQLQGCLPGSQAPLSYSEASKVLAVNECALRVAASRLRQRYRKMLRAEIAATVSSPDEVDAEIRYLKEALTKP